MKKTLTAGVLGAGHLGKIHLRLLQESKRYTLVGFYDPDVKASKDLAKSASYTYFESQEALIAACDVVDIVTPTPYHHIVAKACIEAGKHFLLKNPLPTLLLRQKNLLL